MIAIKGHLKRGREVIQLLESLGGINKWNHTGECVAYAYYIDHCNNIYSFGISGYHGDRKIYTLEEFEKEFPFKVGDKVITIDGTIGIIDRFEPKKDYPYCIKADVGGFYWCETSILKPHKEMQERNITLTLDKAKEWYKKGGELKEIALQAFSEKELNPLPRSWDEYCRKYKFVCLSTRHANISLKYDALIKLEQLRNCWWNGWEPEWNNCEKYVIKWDKNDLMVFTAKNIHAFLVFPTREIAEEFLECFRDLIEKAGDLI